MAAIKAGDSLPQACRRHHSFRRRRRQIADYITPPYALKADLKRLRLNKDAFGTK